jgi:hypothetical protein
MNAQETVPLWHEATITPQLRVAIYLKVGKPIVRPIDHQWALARARDQKSTIIFRVLRLEVSNTMFTYKTSFNPLLLRGGGWVKSFCRGDRE